MTGARTEPPRDPGTTRFERFLAVFAEPSEPADRLRIDAFRQLVLLYGFTRSWLWFRYVASEDRPLLAATALAASVGLALAFAPSRSWRILGPRIALVGVFLQLAWRFEAAANHLFLELFVLVLLALDGGEDDDAALVLRGLRWATVIVLFHTGLQKVFYGLYWQGEFLALMVSAQDRFARIFQLLLPGAEVARLSLLDYAETGAGPYRVSSLPFLFASNATIAAELGLPVLLALRRTRFLGVLGSLGLMFVIQVAALEIGFASLFVNLLLLQLSGPWTRRLLPGFALLFAYALGAAYGPLPGNPLDWNLT